MPSRRILDETNQQASALSLRRFIAYQKKEGFSQKEIAKKYGVGETQLSRWIKIDTEEECAVNHQDYHGGPCLRRHAFLLVAVFHPDHVKKVMFFFRKPHLLVRAYRKSLALSKRGFGRCYGVDPHIVTLWEKQDSQASPALHRHFVLVRNILRFAVSRFERSEKRRKSKEKTKTEQSATPT